MIQVLWIFLAIAGSSVLGQSYDTDRRTRGKNERCYRHEKFPEPSECCTRPHWINQYLVRPCRFSNIQRDGYGQQEHEACSVGCGVYRIYMAMLNNQVNSVRVFRPTRLQGYGDEDWKRTVTSALKLCKQRITSMIGNRATEGREAEQCEEANDIFADCLDGQLYLQCPARVFIRSDGCERSKGHLMDGCPFRSLTDTTERNRNDWYDRNQWNSVGNGGPDQDDGDQYDDEYDDLNDGGPTRNGGGNNRNNNNRNANNGQ